MLDVLHIAWCSWNKQIFLETLAVNIRLQSAAVLKVILERYR